MTDQNPTSGDVAEKPQRHRCPFVYSTGRRCCGDVIDVRFYGNLRHGFSGVRKVRMWCSDKWDHTGMVCGSGYATKERMEFYPDKIPSDLSEFVWGQLDAQRPKA